MIKYYDSFIEDNCFCVMMEYGGKKNLKQFIEYYKNNCELIPENIIEKLIVQICEGLKEIHKNNLIHRDLTPDNIFIDENNNIKIGDFGISKILSNNTKYTKSQTGKYHYFAPEMELGKKYNNKVDIYSFGCIIYELFLCNEYYLDKLEGKDCKINTDIYNPKWQNLLNELLRKQDYHERPDIEEVYKLVKSIIDSKGHNLDDYLIKDNLITNYEIKKDNIIETKNESNNNKNSLFSINSLFLHELNAQKKKILFFVTPDKPDQIYSVFIDENEKFKNALIYLKDFYPIVNIRRIEYAILNGKNLMKEKYLESKVGDLQIQDSDKIIFNIEPY